MLSLTTYVKFFQPTTPNSLHLKMSSSNDYYTFRANRDPRRELITDMERYGEANIATFLRTYFPETDTRTGRTFPNHRFLPLIETVVQTNETLVSQHHTPPRSLQ